MVENNGNTEVLLKKGRLLALRIIAEAYLISKGNTNTDKLFADRDLATEKVLKGGEILVLHNWLMEEYQSMGLDLAKAVASNGEAIAENQLSNYEINELVQRADKLILQLNVFKSYIEANKK